MKLKHWTLLGLVVISSLAIGQAVVVPPPLLNIAQSPLFARASLPPLNMLVMGKDHKIYYEAYNDASDLDGDGSLDITYKPASIDYYGYFNSYACYAWSTDKFVPQSHTATKKCSGAWSGDFLNYLTTSRMDALRRVLYGGWRQTDTATETVLQGTYIPQDGHTWGKEYQSAARDGYNISEYAPLGQPAPGKYHLFAVVSVQANTAPLFRVMTNSTYRVWNWLSIESPVAGNKCFNSANTRVDCPGTSSAWDLVPASLFSNLTITTYKRASGSGSPADRAGMDALFNTHATTANRCGTQSISNINGNTNPFDGTNSCSNENFLTYISGTLTIPTTGNYILAVNGDDAIDVFIDGSATPTLSWYNGHGQVTADADIDTHSATINLAAGNHTIVFRHQEATGDQSWKLMLKTPGGAGARTDYTVRVQACPDDTTLQDPSCKAYPGGHYKPTGILHDYGEAERMYFGLITGSQRNNLEGGVLRSNISNFKSEINASTGQFLAVNGIVHNLDALRVIGGGYSDGVTNNLTTDAKWGWNNGTGNCPTPDPSRALANGECRMWGNPIAEMMYESLRYFAGAKAPTARFATTGGDARGDTEETTMGLTKGVWKDPYGTGNDGLGYPTCSRPFQTVISDINPSYDGDLPNSVFKNAVTSTSNTPTSIAGFSPATEGDVIWAHEFGGPRDVFIGEVGGVTNGAPTAKTASTFGNIRGLSPEEPTKGGTYYSASVARYGRITSINAASTQNISTYSIALASPLPKIEFPVGGRTVTLMPFAKTVSGTFGSGSTKPTNTIVDFYVEKIVNVAGQPTTTDNGGRPYAVFRINYEDVEQGNDHDMDAIVRYEIMTNADNTLSVNLTSEYAAGSANQNMGYVISGTTHDGVYLEVRDTDSQADQSLYMLNTPPGAWAGDCIAGTNTPPCNQYLGFTARRTFTPSAAASTAIQLKDPLWYAAKYGGFTDTNDNKLPDGTEWDADKNGVPDNYFLVTNPLNLRSQLTKAFDAIQAQTGASGTISLAGSRVSATSFAVLPSYSSLVGGHDWIGELTAQTISTTGQLGSVRWTASSHMPTDSAGVAARKIFTALSNFDADNRTAAVQPFLASNLGASNVEIFNRLGSMNPFGDFGSITPNDMVNYLRGERSKEGTTKPTAPFRRRSGILGDIINSTPVIASKRANYGWSSASGLTTAQRTAYSDYVRTTKAARPEYVYVGANDGMLHAFDDSGMERFAYVPNGVLSNMAWLADPNYTHRYYVDGATTLSDVLIDNSWQSVLVGATGAGGKSVFAINVSNPSALTANDVLWEVNGQTDADMGYVMGKPLIVPTDNGRWVAIFGNGYNSQNGNPVLFVVDIKTGKVIRKLAPDDRDTATPNGLGNISAIDTNRDGLVDTVYGGDLLGNVWKFGLGTASEAAWGVSLGGAPLFVAKDAVGNRQPITGSFEIAVGPGSGHMLYFGTGRYFVSGDNNASTGQQVQSLYGVWDDDTTAVADTWRTSGLLVAQTMAAGGTKPETRTITRNPVSYLTKRGWYLDLVVAGANTGERFIATPRIQSGKVYLPTYQPGFASDCAPGGKNWLYALDPLSGGAAFGQISLPPSGTVGGGNTGGITTGDGAPSRGVGVTQPLPISPIYCDPSDASCVPGDETKPPDTKCSEVILDASDPKKSLIVQRACGRQSWRQLL